MWWETDTGRGGSGKFFAAAGMLTVMFFEIVLRRMPLEMRHTYETAPYSGASALGSGATSVVSPARALLLLGVMPRTRIYLYDYSSSVSA